MEGTITTYRIGTTIQLIQKTLIPNIDTIPHHLPNQLQQALLAHPLIRMLQLQNAQQFLRRIMVQDLGIVWAVDSADVAGGQVGGIFVGFLDESVD